MAGKIMLTGDRPTGKLHIGHYVGSLRQRLEIQKDPEFDKMFIMIADAQALTDNAENPQKVRESVMQVAMDYLAIGIRIRRTGRRPSARKASFCSWVRSRSKPS